MKPRLFIGSSQENLKLAYAIQEELEFDAEVTVWTQGIFNLSSNAIDDLLKALIEFDFALFVFNPDDITKIRENKYPTVRDNLIFELGLFIGKIGKEKVFYLVPRAIKDFHLPTDLIGMMPGTYDNNREDGNLRAAVGPFCNQIRELLKKYIFENINDLTGESEEVKKIAISKGDFWEYFLACQLLDDKLIAVEKNYVDIENDLIIQRKRTVNGQEYFDFFKDSVASFISYVNLLNKCLEELNKSFGPHGVAGKPIEIKNAVDRIIQLCKELVSWEYELNSIIPPDKLLIVKLKMKGWTKTITEQINNLSKETRKSIQNYLDGDQQENRISIVLTLKSPDGMGSEIVRYFEDYFFQN